MTFYMGMNMGRKSIKRSNIEDSNRLCGHSVSSHFPFLFLMAPDAGHGMLFTLATVTGENIGEYLKYTFMVVLLSLPQAVHTW